MFGGMRGGGALAAELLSALTSASPSSLSAALSSPPLSAGLCHALLPALPTPASLQILALLGRDRAAELSLPARAGLIVGLATAPASPSAPRLLPPAASAVAGLLLSTRSTQLTRLKEAVNVAAPGAVDLFTLVHRRIDGAARAELLQHFAVQGEAAVAAAGGAPLSFKIVSDFDDTLRQGWVDRRVPRRAWYPGARAFLAELRSQAAAWGGEALEACERGGGSGGGGDFTLGWWAQGGGEAPARGARAREAHFRSLFAALAAEPPPARAPPPPPRQDVPGAIALVSARPPLLRRMTMRNLPAVGESAAVAPMPPAPAPDSAPSVAASDSEGDVTAVALGPLFAAPAATSPAGAPPPPFHATLLMSSSVLSTATIGGIVAEKSENVALLRCLWPEYGWLLLGDAGQGDAAVAAAAAARYGLPQQGGSSSSGGGGGDGGAQPPPPPPSRTNALSRSPAAPGCALAAALLHDVTPGAAATGDGGLKSRYAAGGQALFSTYAGAAVAAAGRGLLSRDALWRVCAATAAEAEGLQWAGHAGAAEARARLLAAVGADLRAAAWPGCAALGAGWAEAEARVAGAEGAEAAARQAGLAEARGESEASAQHSEKDLRTAAWAASRG
jgi:hypothetical protein